FKKITFLFMAVLLFSGPVSAQTKLVMVIDTTQKQILSPDDIQIDSILAEQVTIDIFLEDGYDVEIFHTNDGDAALSTYDQSVIDELDVADLIVLGRRVASFSFDSPDKELWNGLYPPIMTSNMWACRGSRMNWFNSEGIYTNTALEDSALVYANIENPEDEIFEDMEELYEGLDLTDTVAWWYGPHNTMDPAGDYGNGTLMATEAGGTPIWVRFDDGDEFYPGSVDYPEGERVYFGLGCEVNNRMQYYSRYTEVSKEIFLREAARLSGHDRGAVNVKKVYNGIVASKVYFNPATQKLVVEMDNLNKVEVLDISGKLVYTALAKSNKLFIDLGFAERSMYLVRLIDNKNNLSINKIIK
ncbi:MAG: T9SS type A sorting domain-containing protein, partial [Bacteroidales bacterium]